MKIVIRVVAFAAVLGVYYGVAALLPADAEAAVGLVAVATVAIGEFTWARRDGRVVDLSDGLRDWLVVACVLAVFWWVTLVRFEGATDVVDQIRTNFLSVVLTAAVLYAPPVVGLLLGRDARRA
ncbi:MAG TPA: hypothetical protein VMZ66_09165 [Aeromicrobium sp.]|nr:hypothetical protein [Aeromicrobium sp.]